MIKKTKITSAEFTLSSTDVKKCPPEELPEYAFIGRSNVGKSSLINMLVNRKEMARTSVKPGKTQLINHFLINRQWYLVDLPGYGYATLAKEKKQEFDLFVRNYLMQRLSLLYVFVLIDLRLPMQPIDRQFMEWLAQREIGFCMVFTKADKLGKTQIRENLENYISEMLKSWEEMPAYFITSSKNATGREEILQYIENANKVFKKPRPVLYSSSMSSSEGRSSSASKPESN